MCMLNGVVKFLPMQGLTVKHDTCMVLWCLQTLFVQRLHEVEAAGDAPSSSAPTGLPQKELLSWYFDKMVERCFTVNLLVTCALHTCK